jgi:hypothetical protein
MQCSIGNVIRSAAVYLYMLQYIWQYIPKWEMENILLFNGPFYKFKLLA